MTPDPSIAWTVVLTLLTLSNLAVAFVTLTRGNRTQKREISFADTYATKAEVETVRQDVRRLGDSMEMMRREAKADKEDILEADEQRAVALHNRVNDVLSAVSRLEGQLERIKR